MKRHRSKKGCLFAVLAFAALAAPAAAQDRRGLVWNDRPSIVFGEDINIDIKGRVQFDGRWFDPRIVEDEFDVRTLRIGLKGDLTRHFDWEIEREIDELFDAGVTEDQIDLGLVEPKWRFGEWKDLFINWSTFDAIRIKAGRFKMPFGLEQNTSVSDLDFAYRTLGSVKIAPGRDTGVMVYGELLDNSLIYEAGVFDDDGDNGELEEERFVLEGEDLENIGPSFAARVVGEIFRRLPVHDRLKGAEVGIAYTRSYIPEGLNSLQGEDLWGYDFFERVYVKGHRQRLGLQWDWSPGPTGFKAEWMQSREQRLGQSNRNEDLSDFIGTAWYASATWIITGEDKDSDVTPNNPLFQGGLGLFEIGVRYDKLTFTSANTAGTAFRNPRSDVLLPNGVGKFTLGGNWLVNRWVKVVANGFRQSYADVERTPQVVGAETFGPTVFWSGLLRLQIAF
jgi:phosphate-selective porin OprO/OprP